MGLVFYLTVCKLSLNAPLAFLSAIVYAIHPINGIIVNYLTASEIALCVIFMQLSLLFLIYFFEKKRQIDYVFSFMFFVLACFSHEMAIIFPFYLLAYIFCVQRQQWSRLLVIGAPFYLFLVGWFIIRVQHSTLHSQLSNSPKAMANLAAYFSTWMDLLNWYISKLFFPSDIVFLWSVEYNVTHLLRNFLIFILASGLSIVAFYKWRRNWKSFLLAVFILGLLPSLLSCFIYFPIVWPMIEHHWFFFSEMGFFVLAGYVLLIIIQRINRLGWIVVISSVFVLLTFGWLNNAKWVSQEKYCLYWLSLNRGNLTPYYGLGRSLMEQGDYKGAAEVFLGGYRYLRMYNFQLAADLGHCLGMLGRDKESLAWLTAAISNNSQYALAHHYMGLYMLRRGQVTQAQEAFKIAAKLDPKGVSFYQKP
jgi:tetratricopeptide (TPR) repeat protein